MALILLAALAALAGVADGRASAGELLAKHVGIAEAPRTPADMLQVLQRQQLEGQWTEGVQAKLLEVLGQIETSVLEKIKEEHGETQKQLDERIETLENKTNKLRDFKAAADIEQLGWYVCLKVEKELAARNNKSHDELQLRLQEKEAAKKAEEDAQAYLAPAVPNFGNLTCEESFTVTASPCVADFATYKATILEWLSQEKTSMQTHVKNHGGKEGNLTKAEEAHQSQSEHYDQNVSKWEEQIAECVLQKTEFHVHACRFGGAYQDKCVASADFEQLASQAQSSGNSFSASDRQREWSAAAVTACLLRKFTNEKILSPSNLSNNVLQTCQDNVSYSRDVGSLAFHEAEQARLTAPANFTCKEEVVGFGNKTSWRKVPLVSNPNTSAYQRVENVTHPLSAAPEAQPLAMCAEPEEQTTCGAAAFKCEEEGQVVDQEELCLLASGCTAGECCQPGESPDTMTVVEVVDAVVETVEVIVKTVAAPVVKVVVEAARTKVVAVVRRWGRFR